MYQAIPVILALEPRLPLRPAGPRAPGRPCVQIKDKRFHCVINTTQPVLSSSRMSVFIPERYIYKPLKIF